MSRTFLFNVILAGAIPLAFGLGFWSASSSPRPTAVEANAPNGTTFVVVVEHRPDDDVGTRAILGPGEPARFVFTSEAGYREAADAVFLKATEIKNKHGTTP